MEHSIELDTKSDTFVIFSPYSLEIIVDAGFYFQTTFAVKENSYNYICICFLRYAIGDIPISLHLPLTYTYSALDSALDFVKEEVHIKSINCKGQIADNAAINAKWDTIIITPYPLREGGYFVEVTEPAVSITVADYISHYSKGYCPLWKLPTKIRK